ncbi:hypothetical protein [Argonema galeatum]|nr:hypothetical protein [Argonema galeatum]MCL1463478.1 hypothetical protein [Argonema galeatum A003/A1]
MTNSFSQPDLRIHSVIDMSIECDRSSVQDITIRCDKVRSLRSERRG